jgi:hypothetical protein
MQKAGIGKAAWLSVLLAHPLQREAKDKARELLGAGSGPRGPGYPWFLEIVCWSFESIQETNAGTYWREEGFGRLEMRDGGLLCEGRKPEKDV